MTEAPSSAAALPVMLALDFPDAAAARALVARLPAGQVGLKIGLELFTAAGPALVREWVHAGQRVFLDLKFHDIPNTVARACRVAAELGVYMLNVHAAGGARMLAAAREALGDGPERPRLIAVTVLTSLDEQDLQGLDLPGSPEARVDAWSALAFDAGLDGVVCSAVEAARLRARYGPDWLLVCPGIRFEQGASDDQRRTLQPKAALEAGADWLVIGRPITQAPDPALALRRLVQDLGLD